MPLGRKNSGHRGTAGFTLVELGVVMAMTGILTALLLPALSTAKEKSRRAVCQSNIRQDFVGMVLYATENEDYLPSAADNEGLYHSIQLSDQTFTNFVANQLGGVSSVLYCPNFDYGGMPLTNRFGHVIGYSYLAGSVQTTSKGPEAWSVPQKLYGGPATNALLADANYWTVVPGTSAAGALTIAPHTASGGAIAAAVTVPSGANARAVAPLSISIGAVGGNVGYMDGSVVWKPIKAMSVYQASSDEFAHAAW